MDRPLCEGPAHFVPFLDHVRVPLDDTLAVALLRKGDDVHGGEDKIYLCAGCLSVFRNTPELTGGGIGMVEFLTE